VPNLFIDSANFGSKKSLRECLRLKNKNISRIASFNNIKGAFSIKISFWKGPASILKKLGGQKIPAGTGLGISTIVFPVFHGSSQNSCENSSRTLLATYYRELEKVPVLVSNFGN
jgi:hypothetical protein